MQNKWNELQTVLASENFLATGSNPVVTNILNGNLTAQEGIEVLRQYYYLVATIVQFLTIAMVRIPVAKAKNELRRNLGEELGSRTHGVTHQEILEQYLLNELSVSVRAPWNNETKTFITGLLLDFSIQSARFAAGMIYALEATACPELKVVAEIINAASQKEVVNLDSLNDQSQVTELKKHGVTSLQDFLAWHTLDFEVGHESGLRETLEVFASEDWEEFQRGFTRVLDAMRTWWSGLAGMQ